MAYTTLTEMFKSTLVVNTTVTVLDKWQDISSTKS